jgi:PAS domain S-box-containing protein
MASSRALSPSPLDRPATEDTPVPLAAILENIEDAISGADLAGNINYWSPSAERVFGYSAAEVLGHSARMLFADDQPDALDRILAAVRRGEVVRQQEGLRIRRDGSQFHVSSTISPVRRDGVIVGLCAVSRDMTDKIRMQHQLALADRLASAGSLAAGVAHEINNPLAGLIANLVHLGEHLAADAAARGPLEDARTCAQRIGEIVRDLRFLSSPDGAAHRAIDVRTVVQATVRIAAPEIRARARLVEDYQAVPPVDGNPGRLNQVLVNLVLNATQAIAEGNSTGNEIFVGTRTDGDGRAVITVRDTGVGIAPDHLARIFDPFFTTRPIGDGTGLGLAVCHRLISELGGEIRVQSSAGRGSTFEVVPDRYWVPTSLPWRMPWVGSCASQNTLSSCS